jgi:hypothetical protein
MAFGAVGFRILAESFIAVVAYAAVLILAVSLFGHLQIFFFHFEDFCVAIGAFLFGLINVVFVAEEDGAATPLGFEFNIPAAGFFLLGIGRIDGCKTQNTNSDKQNLPDSISQDFTSLC